VIGLDLHGESLNKFDWPSDFNLLVGEEGRGIPKSLIGQSLHIPMAQGVESLNAAVAISIALYSFRTQHPIV
jgi:RNA methyltransferase, TrmH family